MNRIFTAETFQRVLADVLFPEHNACHLCGRFAQRPGIACQECMEKLRALRFSAKLMAAHDSHPPLMACLAAWPHIAQPRSLVHLLKYQSDGEAAAVLGEVDWLMVGSAAVLAGLLSLLTSVAGLPEVKEE